MTASPSPPLRPQWSSEVRTWVSLALFVHLFAVVVAVTTYTRPSSLQVRLHELFGPYLRALHMTVYRDSYPVARYYLSHTTPIDFDFKCEVEFPGADGKAQTVTLPRPGLEPLIRWRRYQSLANAAGALVQPEGNEDLAGILPKALAAGLIRQHGAKQGMIRIRANFSPIQEALRPLNAGRRTPLESYPELYEAQVFVTPSGAELLKKSATLEVAPAEAPGKKPATPPGQKAPQK